MGKVVKVFSYVFELSALSLFLCGHGGTLNSLGMCHEVCKDIAKPLKHMITVLWRIPTKKEQQAGQIDQ